MEDIGDVMVTKFRCSNQDPLLALIGGIDLVLSTRRSL